MNRRDWQMGVNLGSRRMLDGLRVMPRAFQALRGCHHRLEGCQAMLHHIHHCSDPEGRSPSLLTRLPRRGAETGITTIMKGKGLDGLGDPWSEPISGTGHAARAAVAVQTCRLKRTCWIWWVSSPFCHIVLVYLNTNSIHGEVLCMVFLCFVFDIVRS